MEKKKKEVPIIVMWKNPDGSVDSVEVETMKQAKAVQAALNAWAPGYRAETEFIYLD